MLFRTTFGIDCRTAFVVSIAQIRKAQMNQNRKRVSQGYLNGLERFSAVPATQQNRDPLEVEDFLFKQVHDAVEQYVHCSKHHYIFCSYRELVPRPFPFFFPFPLLLREKYTW